MKDKKKKTKKKHRHTWEPDGDGCHECGAWTEYCKNCDATREMDGTGKEVDRYE